MENLNKSFGNRLEFIVVVMLAVTALCTAWASWVSSVHASNQAQNYTTSNNLSAEGNSEYNAGLQNMMQDMMLYNEINNLSIDLQFAYNKNDKDEIDKIEWKIDELIAANMTDTFAEAYYWSLDESDKRKETVSPFEKEGFVDSYFATAFELLSESDELLKMGNSDNDNSSRYALVTVIFSVVLFLLGISATIKNEKYRLIVVAVSIIVFLIALVYMLSIPMPRDFSFSSFFAGGSE